MGPWEAELFPVHNVTFPHYSIDLVVWSKSVVTYVPGSCDFASMWDRHAMTAACTRVVEDPIATRVVGGSEFLLMRGFCREVWECHVAMDISDLLM